MFTRTTTFFFATMIALTLTCTAVLAEDATVDAPQFQKVNNPPTPVVTLS